MHNYSIAMKTKDGEERVLFTRDTMNRPPRQAAIDFVVAAEEDGFKVLWIMPHGDAK